MLIDENGFLFIVDWDDSIMAPKERDLMFIGGGVANVWNNPREEEFFYKGYGKTEINQALLAYYRHERIIEDVAEYALEVTSDEDLDLTARLVGEKEKKTRESAKPVMSEKDRKEQSSTFTQMVTQMWPDLLDQTPTFTP